MAQVQGDPPLNVHEQVEPEQSACQTSPALSWHDVMHVTVPFGPPPPVPPRHEPAPAPGRGIPGHTLAGTPPLEPGGPAPGAVGVVERPGATQAPTACCSESQPGNSTSPELEQVGSTVSMQRSNAAASAPQDNVIETRSEQLFWQSVAPPAVHPALTILSQAPRHDAETWAGER